MAPLKRKRPHEDPDPPPPTSSTTTTAAAAPTPTAAAVAGAADSTRRATRQTPILPPPIPTSQSQSAAEDKRRRSSASTNPRPQLHKISETPIPIPVPPSSTSSTTQSAGQNPPAAAAPAAAPEPRASRRKSGTAADSTAAMGAAVKEAKENVRPVTLVAPKITYQASQPTPHRTGGSLVRPSPPTSQPPITSHFRPVARQPYQHGIPATVTHVPVPVPPTSTPKQQQQQQPPPPPPQQHTPAAPKPTPSKPQPQTHTQTHTKPQTQTAQAQTSTPRAADKSAPRTDRNIDKVILGNICFRAWYPSYYGKEVLGDASVSGKSGAATAGTTSGKNPPAAAGDGAKNQHRKGADAPILDRLYVCPVCFKYSKELVAWWGHVRMCERAGAVPGRKVYTHPRGRRLVRKEMPRQGGKKGNVAARFTEEVVTDEGEWSVWEVDGEQDVLFCQNLSLFAKLFLDNKSVFFDVRGFNYFLLVYTPPPPKPDPAATPAAATADQQQQQAPRPHIVGFFSKEKMSWDNNNLACILVFPPWQRKGLGALLMGVSYEISRREGVLGGPEKPISELGRKGYKRFWGGEIARWLLGCGTNETNNGEVERELLVDVEDCCKATWIALDDCLVTLREMGVVVEGGTGPGKPPAKRKRQGADGEEGEDEDVEMEDAGEEEAEKPDVPRVRVDKEAVWAWVQANKISLEKVCDPDGFVEGYAIKEVEEDDDEE
ncbi:Males-absent on the first protein [Colletotrichum gloeosporioides]|uniref:histone acetyltransferase n=2 Tax=Colletotrichum gloeosporioides TaxID=474922 RepID=A0A8H4FKM7_COLGL|nr:Males-absent on the first protein [Colletotrichum gloeosporioides]KAF3805637.1 Males-absent on the first protein [Colletotrichum gloeosporioides]